MRKIESEFGIHEGGLPGPEEISDEENRLKSRKGLHKGKFITPEDLPSKESDPLELLIAKEEQEKNKKEEKEPENEDMGNEYSNYDPDTEEKLKEEAGVQRLETEGPKSPDFSSRESESMRASRKKNSKMTTRQQAQGKRGKESKQKYGSQNRTTIRKNIETVHNK